MLGITGQQKRNSIQSKIVGELPTIFPLEDLNKPEAMLNRRELSGKAEGMAITVKDEDGNFFIYVATGSKPEDKWIPLNSKIEADVITKVQEYPLELVDMVDVVVKEEYADIVQMIPNSTTNLVQTPIKEASGTLAWRNHLTFSGGFKWLQNTSAARKRFDLKINGLLANENQYFHVLSFLATLYTVDGTGDELPVCMPVIRDANTGTLGIWVDTLKSEATAFGLNLVVEWDSPNKLLS